MRQRAFGDPDAVSFGDYHVAKDVGWALTGTPFDDAQLEEYLEPWRPQRGRVPVLVAVGGLQETAARGADVAADPLPDGLARREWRERVGSRHRRTSYSDNRPKENTMKFLMLVSLDPTHDENDVDDTGTLDVEDWVTKYDDAGVRVIGQQVRMAEDSTSVTRSHGRLVVTDGPYAETREWIVGFDVLECADLDEAIKVAGEHPMSAGGRLELRPFVED